MSHFHSSVSEQTKTNLLLLAELIESELVHSLNREALGCSRLDNIDGTDSSGYIAYQRGGYSVSELYSNNLDKSHQLTRKQSEWIDSQSSECYADFLSDNGVSELTDDLSEKYHEFERDWMSEALALFRVWVEDDNTINIDFGVNYADAPYYRNGSTENVMDFGIPLTLFNNISTAKWLESVSYTHLTLPTKRIV